MEWTYVYGTVKCYWTHTHTHTYVYIYRESLGTQVDHLR